LGFNGDLYQESGATSVLSTKGDLVRYDSERERYGIGSAGQVLQVASSLPTWSTINLADSVLTTQGDVLYEGASALARLGQSTNNYTLATKGSGQNPAWQASSTSTLSGTGDILYSSGANTLARLGIGSTDDVLTVAGGVPTWASAGGGGAWTSEGTYTAPDDNQTDFTITLNNAFDKDKAELYIVGNGAQTSTTGQDWLWQINEITSGDYADSKVESDNGGSTVTGIHSNANEWNLSNQRNPDFASFRIWAYVSQDESDNLIPHGYYTFEGASSDSSLYCNTRYGSFQRETDTTEISSLKFFLSGAGKFKTDMTVSVWSLAKS